MEENTRYIEVCNPRMCALEKLSGENRCRVQKNETRIAELRRDAEHTLDSVRGVVKALWAVALSSVTALVSFLIWYIQTR